MRYHFVSIVAMMPSASHSPILYMYTPSYLWCKLQHLLIRINGLSSSKESKIPVQYLPTIRVYMLE